MEIGTRNTKSRWKQVHQKAVLVLVLPSLILPYHKAAHNPHLISQIHHPPPTVPQTQSCSLSYLITRPLTVSLALLVSFGLLVYGLYLLTPNLRRPKQKPLRLTPLVEYNLAFDRLVEDLKRVLVLGGHKEVVREVR